MEKYRETASNADSVKRAFQATFSLEALEALVLLRNPGVKAHENHVKATIETFGQHLIWMIFYVNTALLRKV
jgi:hypothetical protein